jgi:hypothetical protein
VRFFSTVCGFHVEHQRTPLRVLLAANLACVRFFFGVNSKVYFQTLPFGEPLLAVTARERFFSGVSLDVVSQTRNRAQFFTASLAQISRFALFFGHLQTLPMFVLLVVPHAHQRVKLALADVAQVALPFVNGYSVLFQSSRCYKLLVARRARVGFSDLDVYFLVVVQQSLLYETLVANFTNKPRVGMLLQVSLVPRPGRRFVNFAAIGAHQIVAGPDFVNPPLVVGKTRVRIVAPFAKVALVQVFFAVDLSVVRQLVSLGEEFAAQIAPKAICSMHFSSVLTQHAFSRKSHLTLAALVLVFLHRSKVAQFLRRFFDFNKVQIAPGTHHHVKHSEVEG